MCSSDLLLQPHPAEETVEDRQGADCARLQSSSSRASLRRRRGSGRRSRWPSVSRRHEQGLLPGSPFTPASPVARPHRGAGSCVARRAAAEEGNVQCVQESRSRSACGNTYDECHRRKSSPTRLTSKAFFVSRASAARRREMDIAAPCERREQSTQLESTSPPLTAARRACPPAFTRPRRARKFQNITNQMCGK